MTRRDGHSALRVRDGQLEIFDPHPEIRARDVAVSTPLVVFAGAAHVDIDYTHAHRLRSTHAGFGFALPLLEGHPPAKHPWLTPAVIHVEQAIDEHRADSERVFLESMEAETAFAIEEYERGKGGQ